MANIKSAKKRARQAVKRTETNRSRTSRIRTYVKKVETAIASGDKTAAQAALKDAEPEVARGVTKGVLHRNTAARKISRLTHRVRAMGATA
jgi:small subunit ribosomal protein S20